MPRGKARQIDRLIAGALQVGSVPLYALYSDRIHDGVRVCARDQRGLAGGVFSAAILPAGAALEWAGTPSVVSGLVL